MSSLAYCVVVLTLVPRVFVCKRGLTAYSTLYHEYHYRKNIAPACHSTPQAIYIYINVWEKQAAVGRACL